MRKLPVSICIPAYNEEKNIPFILQALRRQKTHHILINKIVVVCSGCTDKTVKIVQRFIKKDNRIKLIEQSTRAGKTSAINAFLEEVSDPVVVVESADTIPREKTIENLCKPFLLKKNIGMTGGAPIPVNNRNTFVGYIIHCWWWFHRQIPRFGEIIAFRNELKGLPNDILVDEAYVQAKFIKNGYKVVHIDKAVVNNKGPDTVSELIKQRRKLFVGHAKLHAQEGVRISNMTKSSLRLLFFEFKMKNMQQLIWLLGGIGVELWARILGHYDTYIKKINPYIWDMATTTKDLSFAHQIRKPLKKGRKNR